MRPKQIPRLLKRASIVKHRERSREKQSEKGTRERGGRRQRRALNRGAQGYALWNTNTKWKHHRHRTFERSVGGPGVRVQTCAVLIICCLFHGFVH